MKRAAKNKEACHLPGEDSMDDSILPPIIYNVRAREAGGSFPEGGWADLYSSVVCSTSGRWAEQYWFTLCSTIGRSVKQ